MAGAVGATNCRTCASCIDRNWRCAEADAEAAAKLVGKQTAADGHATPAELAAWVVVGRTLMNLDEFITRE